MPFLSVIVPIYNAAKYLEECLDSIINQTFQDFELILVNDGSTDLSKEICERYVKGNANVHLINKENGGLVSARKAGLALAQGEYIGWVDADDSVMPQMYEEMCNEAMKTKTDIVICDIWSWEGDKLMPLKQAIRNGGFYSKEDLKKDFYPYMLYAGKFYTFGILPAQFNKIVRAPIIKKNLDLVDNRISIGEDAACTYFCMLDAESISYLKGKFLYKYRANLGSMCHVWKKEKIISASILLNYFYKRLKEYDFPQVMDQYWYYFVCMYTNMIYEYGAFLLTNKKKPAMFQESIVLNCDLQEEFLGALKRDSISLPVDRKIMIESAMSSPTEKQAIAKFVLFVCFAGSS